MNVELKGIITDIFPVGVVGANGFKKRVFWLKQDDTEKYPQHWQIELHQASITLLDKIIPGDKVTCSINIRGRYYKNNHKAGVINTLQCWKIIKEEAVNEVPSNIPPSPIQSEFVDDLPF